MDHSPLANKVEKFLADHCPYFDHWREDAEWAAREKLMNEIRRCIQDAEADEDFHAHMAVAIEKRITIKVEITGLP